MPGMSVYYNNLGPGVDGYRATAKARPLKVACGCRVSSGGREPSNLPPKRIVYETPVLYHLGQDPAEQFDIAAEHPEIVSELLAALAVHQARLESREPIFDSRLKRVFTN